MSSIVFAKGNNFLMVGGINLNKICYGYVIKHTLTIINQ